MTAGMIDDTQRLLDDILTSWFVWARSYQHVSGIGSSPMFRDAKISRGWDTTSDIVDGEIEHCRCASVDFHIGEMNEPYRTAVSFRARNLSQGINVWSSPRLPEDQSSRIKILNDACGILMKRLSSAGIM